MKAGIKNTFIAATLLASTQVNGAVITTLDFNNANDGDISYTENGITVRPYYSVWDQFLGENVVVDLGGGNSAIRTSSNLRDYGLLFTSENTDYGIGLNSIAFLENEQFVLRSDGTPVDTDWTVYGIDAGNYINIYDGFFEGTINRDSNEIFTNSPAEYGAIFISSNGVAGFPVLIDDASFTIYNGQSEPNPVPEPTTLLLLGAGVAGLLLGRRREEKIAPQAKLAMY